MSPSIRIVEPLSSRIAEKVLDGFRQSMGGCVTGSEGLAPREVSHMVSNSREHGRDRDQIVGNRILVAYAAIHDQASGVSNILNGF
jgi:hypothetical protein